MTEFSDCIVYLGLLKIWVLKDGAVFHSISSTKDFENVNENQWPNFLQFLRLQGKKQRGKEEITLIDVNADDFTDPSEITKHLTEEQTYQSHKKKDNQPTGQQKRKHQIQYLAFQVS